MHLVLLEFTEQVINLFRFRNEVWRTDQTLPAECGRLTEMWQQVFDIEHTADIIRVVLIYRNPTVVILHNTLKYIAETTLDVQVNHILPTGHHLFHGLVTEADDTPQHALIVLDLLLVGQVQRLLQVVHTQYMTVGLQHPLCQETAA